MAVRPVNSGSAKPSWTWRTLISAFLGGGTIGALGGLIGLGGAEFRLPLLISGFGFPALRAVILNKAMSLIVVATALPARSSTVAFADLWLHGHIILKLLCGSLVGAYAGAGLATRMSSAALHRVIAILLVMMAVVLLVAHGSDGPSQPVLSGAAQTVAAVVAGFCIGVVASLLGVAGGELLIPTIILLFGADPKLAGSLSLAVSLPTMLVGFARYSRDRSFDVLRESKHFVLAMAAGSLIGTLLGGYLLGFVPSAVLLPLLAGLLLISAVKVWRH